MLQLVGLTHKMCVASSRAQSSGDMAHQRQDKMSVLLKLPNDVMIVCSGVLGLLAKALFTYRQNRYLPVEKCKQDGFMKTGMQGVARPLLSSYKVRKLSCMQSNSQEGLMQLLLILLSSRKPKSAIA